MAVGDVQCCLDGCDQVEVGKSFIIQLDWEAEVAFLREEEVNCGGDEEDPEGEDEEIAVEPTQLAGKT